MTLVKQNPPTTPEDQLRFLRALVLAFIGIRFVYAAGLQLIPDEATYWVWSRHLAAGYLDHPPGIAFLIRAGTYLLGEQYEIAVRMLMPILAAGAILITMAIARHVLNDARAAVWVCLIWLTSPLLAGLGTFATPDTPAVFFSVCALAFAILIAARDDRAESPVASPLHWCAFGLFTGLAFLSKYTTVLLPASIVLAMLFSQRGRRHFRRPWIYLSGILALLVFTPVIWWNAHHQWASFLFQIHHGTQTADDAQQGGVIFSFIRFWKDAGTYIGGQAGIFTPILFAIAILVLVTYWRRYRSITLVDRVLLWSGTLPLVFFGMMFLKSHRGEVNWPAFSYFPISLLIVRWLSEKWEGRRRNWAMAGVQLSFGILIVMHVIMWPGVTARLVRLPMHIPHVFTDLIGWREFGRAIGSEAAMANAQIVGDRHQVSAEASFYVPGQPDVWCINDGSRPEFYDYFDEKPDFTKIPAVLWIGGHREPFARQYGYVEETRTDLTFLPGKNERLFNTFLLVRPQR